MELLINMVLLTLLAAITIGIKTKLLVSPTS